MIKLLGLGLVSLLAMGCASHAVQPPSTAVASQVCAGGAVYGDAQLEGYRHCAKVSGDLKVEGVCGVSALSGLRQVSGTLSISLSEGMDSLKGLEQLESVSGLEVRDNAHLADISQLSQLRVANRVVIEGNSRLRNLQGLSGLTQVDRLSLLQNGLYSLHGLENLRQVEVLQLADNPLLVDAGALNQLVSARSVVIERNPRLCAWFGLLRGLTHTEQVAMSGNIGLDKSTLLRFEKPATRVSIAQR